ncbi:MAG: TonB-dependent receptor [Sedimentisphaerales bacterium]|nr:TonB-dependent receptor [Sedimentisphaerales bacterium]
MSTKKILLMGQFLTLAIWVLFGLETPASAEQQVPNSKEDLLKMSIEELMKVPIAFASSKRAQPITEAASSVEVVTAEDIRQSGAINLADVLRNVVGVQVRETSVNSHAIGVRGFADGQHVLITLDGSSMYLHCMNYIYPDLIPVTLEEIERIEIVKGPGGVFYGGSAFSGVINIVTKTPRQLEGTQINTGGGSWDTARGNILHGESWKNWDYSFGAGFLESDYMSPPRAAFMNEDTLISQGFGKIVHYLDDESSVSADFRELYADDAISRHCENARNICLTLRYDRPDFWIRGFYNEQSKNVFQGAFRGETTNYELETMRIFKWGKNITSIGGFAKTVNLIFKGNAAGTKSDNSIEDYAVNAENQYHATDNLILTLAGRVEHFSEINWLGLGRGSIIYKLTDKDRLAATIANGYSLPSVVQLYGLGDVMPWYPFNPSLKEDKITSYELSYYGQLAKNIKLRSAVFYNDYEGLVPYDMSITPENSVDARQYGVELGLDCLLTEWLTGFANYTYQTIDRTDIGNLEVDPRNMVNFGFRAKSGKWSSSLTFHYVDAFYEIYDAANPPVLGRLATPQKVDHYITVDARLAYKAGDNLEFALSAINLFNNEHYETNQTGGTINGDKVRRRVLAGVSYKF